jgi:hypothetical protein
VNYFYVNEVNCVSASIVIAAMTVGKDVSSLFAEVLNCMQTDNIGLKKLVYLYLINYAKSQPDLVILAVNTFVKVCENFNTKYLDFFSTLGLTGSKSAHKSTCCSNNGMYSCQ